MARGFLALVALCLLSGAPEAPAAAAAAAPPPFATTSLGKLIGAACKSAPNVSRFTAIPYAKPPTGPRRFAPPEPYATKFPPRGRKATAAIPKCAQYGEGKEDCLYLNVYKPVSATPSSKLPVRVFIHGGSLEVGSAGDYDGCMVANDADVVLVNINYRLGPFGYLALPELAAAGGKWKGANGNWGTLDQRLALEWVQSNVGAFGGNPTRVMLYGESAGCWSVISQMLMPGAGGLFSSAACQSEGIADLMGEPMADAVRKSEYYKSALGCGGAGDIRACMVGASYRAVSRAWSGNPAAGRPRGNLAAAVDGVVLPDWPAKMLQRGEVTKVPFLAGFNTNEGASLVDESWYTAILSGEADDITDQQLLQYVSHTLQDVPSSFQAELLERYTPSNPEFNNSTIAVAASLTGDMDIVCASLRTMKLMAGAGVPVYSYLWSQAPSAGCAGVLTPYEYNLKADALTIARSLLYLNGSHGAELQQVFMDTYRLPQQYKVPCSEEEQQMSSWMSGLWNAFAATGAPSDPISKTPPAPQLKAAPAWPRFTEASQTFYYLNYYAPGPFDSTALTERCSVFDRMFEYYQGAGSYYLW